MGGQCLPSAMAEAAVTVSFLQDKAALYCKRLATLHQLCVSPSPHTQPGSALAYVCATTQQVPVQADPVTKQHLGAHTHMLCARAAQACANLPVLPDQVEQECFCPVSGSVAQHVAAAACLPCNSLQLSQAPLTGSILRAQNTKDQPSILSPAASHPGIAPVACY